LLIECAINSARTDDSINHVRKWLESGEITDLNGIVLPGLSLSSKHKQSLVRRIYSSETIPLEEKERFLQKLEAEDSSDWTEKTKHYCKAAIPT
jgi:hypothetical protein